MSPRKKRIMSIISCLISLAAVSAAVPPYQDASQSIEARILDLLDRMTLEEKVNQTLNDYFSGAFGEEGFQNTLLEERRRHYTRV